MQTEQERGTDLRSVNQESADTDQRSVPLTVDEATVLNALRQVIDPEIGCNIVDLGLIYSIEIQGAHVTVLMTLTTPGCPMHDSIAGGVSAVVQSLEPVEDVDVQVVWDPPWNPAMMTEHGRAYVEMH